MTDGALGRRLSCPASRGVGNDGERGSSRCGGRLEPRDGTEIYLCSRCRREYGSIAGGLRFASSAGGAYRYPVGLSTYHEMHFAAFAAPCDTGLPAIANAPNGPSFHAAELQRSWAPSECFYQEICAVIDEKVDGLASGIAVDVGCATGRMSAEMAARGARVLGVDLSEEFIEEARRIVLRSQGRPELELARFNRGTLRVRAQLPWRLGPDDVVFAVADAAHLPLDDAAAQLVLVLNLIDRVTDPAAVLAEAWRCVASGGYLLHSSPYNYVGSSTPDQLDDVGTVFGQMDGELLVKRHVPFPVRLGWAQAVQSTVDEVVLYRKTM